MIKVIPALKGLILASRSNSNTPLPYLLCPTTNYILSWECRAIVDQVQTDKYHGRHGVIISQVLIMRDPHCGRMCF